MSKHVMVDIETLGTQANSVIVSLGAVKFTSDQVGEGLYLRLNLHEQVKAGRVVDPETVSWWMKQSDKARDVFVDDEPPIVHPYQAMSQFVSWCEDADGVWGNGSDFDNVLLVSLCKDFDVDPWPFWKNRCFRTLKALYPDVPYGKEGVEHNALDDAMMQAKHAARVMREKGL